VQSKTVTIELSNHDLRSPQIVFRPVFLLATEACRSLVFVLVFATAGREGLEMEVVSRSIGGVCVLPLLLFINQVTLSVIINADRGELEPVLRFSVDWVGYSHWGWGLGQL